MLPDINIWLAATFNAHQHHELVKGWIEKQEGTINFCRYTQQGFLRLSTNHKIFGDEVLSMDQAWNVYDALLSDPHIFFLEEPSDLDKQWRHYAKGKFHSTKLWNDAYLASLAKVAGIPVVTLDQAFTQFRGLKTVILKDWYASDSCRGIFAKHPLYLLHCNETVPRQASLAYFSMLRKIPST